MANAKVLHLVMIVMPVMRLISKPMIPVPCLLPFFARAAGERRKGSKGEPDCRSPWITCEHHKKQFGDTSQRVAVTVLTICKIHMTLASLPEHSRPFNAPSSQTSHHLNRAARRVIVHLDHKTHPLHAASGPKS